MNRLSRLVHALCLVVALALPLVARAGNDDGFEPVDGSMLSTGEQLPASRMVGLAYGVICGALIVYVVSVVSRMRKVEGELQELKQRLEKSGK